MRIRVVRDRDGKVVCAVQAEQTEPGQVLIEPVLEEGERVEDIESDDAFLDAEKVLAL